MYIEPYKTPEDALRAIRDAVVKRANGRLTFWERVRTRPDTVYCALGAYAMEVHGDPKDVLDEINDDLRRTIQRTNDKVLVETEEQRYERVMAWFRDQLGE